MTGKVRKEPTHNNQTWNNQAQNNQTDMEQSTKARGDRCTAILLAAGKGLRMGGETRKQFMDVGGMPLFTYSLQTMDNCDIITDIVITVPEGDQEYCKETIESCGLGRKVRKIVVGGRERCFSVHNALQAVDWPCDYAFIHDTARPFIEESTMERLYDEVRINKACVAAVPSKDTVKISDTEGFVVQTPKRKNVWIVQTPQVFDFELIKTAHEKMVEQYDELLKKGVIITDDAMVAETFTGNKVKLVMASYRNIKVTSPEDLVTVLAYMKEKK